MMRPPLPIRIRKQRWTGLWMVMYYNGRGWMRTDYFLHRTWKHAVAYATSTHIKPGD